jgi:putative ABC transport system permease protein
MNVKLASSEIKEAVGYVRNTYGQFFPQLPYSQSFMDDAIERMYANDIKHGIYLNVFSFLSIFIASIGLLGISILAGKNQIKEIGIRKVNGAQSGDIIIMLSKKYVRIVIAATLIACPLAYYVVSRWLQNFAYQTKMSWWILLLAGALTLLITLLTVSWQSRKAARRNPGGGVKV